MQVRQCDICGKRASRYVCQECDRQVCERCLESNMWVCSECYKHLGPELSATKTFSSSMLLKLFLLGILLTSAGIVLMVISGFVSGDSGGVIWILPFPPIVLGAGWSYPSWTIVLAVVLTVLGVVLFILLRKQTQKV